MSTVIQSCARKRHYGDKHAAIRELLDVKGKPGFDHKLKVSQCICGAYVLRGVRKRKH